MNRFIKKNLFLVGVLAISGAGILILLGMSAVKFFEMNKYQAETEKMTSDLEELNNRMRTPIPPFRKNVKFIQEDTEGYKKLKKSIHGYFGHTLQDAMTVFVVDLRKQSMERLISLGEMFDKSPELANLKKEFASAVAMWDKCLAAVDKGTADLFKAYRDVKRVEDEEDTQEGRARAIAAQQKKIADMINVNDNLIVQKAGILAAMDKSYNGLLKYFADKVADGEKNEEYKKWAAGNKDDAKELEFYYGICRQNLTVDVLRDTFVEYWEQVKHLGGPRQQTYRNFRLERGATLEQPANSKNKPVLWDTDMWNNARDKFKVAAQKSMLEKIDEKNLEEIFLSAFGLPRDLAKNAILVEAHNSKMRELVREKLEKGNVFVTGVNFGQGQLELIKSNKGFIDSGNTRTVAAANSTGTSSNENAGGASSSILTAEPSDVVRNWEIIGDIAQRIVNANIDSLEGFSYVNLAGDSSNGNYRKYTYIITLVSRESQVRAFMQLLADAYKDNRIYVIKRFSMQKQEDQIQDIIDYASGIIGKEEAADNKDNSGSGDNKNVQVKTAYFKETKNYPECVAGRSTLCRATLVIDYVEATGNQLK